MHPKQMYDEIDEKMKTAHTAQARYVLTMLRRVMVLEDKVEILEKK